MPSCARYFVLVGLAAIVAGFASGCCATGQKHASDLGATEVAVLSVTRWEDYRAALQPKFDLTAAQALEIATPDTRSYEAAVLNAFRSKVAVRLAPSAVLTAGFGAPTAPAGAPTGTPASQPGVTAAGAAAPTVSLEGDLPRLDAAPEMPGHQALKGDSFLRYLGATALFQEVKLLERYVQDAAARCDCEAFIVRLQISNQPFSDEVPYDTYANIAFFSEPVEVSVGANKITGRMNVQPGQETPPAPLPVTETPIVVPLLVTDQIESALLSGRIEELRQMALVLSAAYAGIGGEVASENVNQAIEKAAGRSYQSLFTVGRLANNMLRVRMAARTRPAVGQAGKSGFEYETMARTYNVTLLLLVPTKTALNDTQKPEPKRVYVATRYEYRQPRTGKRFGVAQGTEGDGPEIETRLKELILSGSYGVPESDFITKGIKVVPLAQFAQGNNYSEFIKEAKNINITDGNARRLYMDLNAAKLGTSFDSTDFEVQMIGKVKASFGEGDAYLVDTGDAVEAVIDGVKGIDPLGVSGTWSGIGIYGTTPEEKLALASTGAEVRGRSQLVVKFPSLIKLGVLNRGARPVRFGTVELSYPSVGGTSLKTVASFVAAGTPADAPSLTIGTSVKCVQQSGQKPEESSDLIMTFLLNKTASDMAKGVSGGNDSATDDAVKAQRVYVVRFDGVQAEISGTTEVVRDARPGPSCFAVSGSGRVTFRLTQASAGGKFTVKVTAPANGKAVEPLEFTVGPKPAP